ncbi:MAG: hypothetical protein EBR34_16210 [Sphingomonadaceae bacterium]|nr:hypothetical protein [Sphingomonadaceae bacterium]
MNIVNQLISIESFLEYFYIFTILSASNNKTLFFCSRYCILSTIYITRPLTGTNDCLTIGVQLIKDVHNDSVTNIFWNHIQYVQRHNAVIFFSNLI